MKLLLGAILSACVGLLGGFLIWGGTHDADSRDADRPAEIESANARTGRAAGVACGRPPGALKIAGRGILAIGGGQYLEGAWNGKGRFTVTSRCNEIGVGAGNGPRLFASDVEELVWHQSVSFLSRADALDVIDSLID